MGAARGQNRTVTATLPRRYCEASWPTEPGAEKHPDKLGRTEHASGNKLDSDTAAGTAAPAFSPVILWNNGRFRRPYARCRPRKSARLLYKPPGRILRSP